MCPYVANVIACSIKEDMHRGILICEKDIGVAIANKVQGICVAQCHDTFSSELAKKSNKAKL